MRLAPLRGDGGRALTPQPLARIREILYETSFNIKLFGNEVHCTACSLLVKVKHSCSIARKF